MVAAALAVALAAALLLGADDDPAPILSKRSVATPADEAGLDLAAWDRAARDRAAARSQAPSTTPPQHVVASGGAATHAGSPGAQQPVGARATGPEPRGRVVQGPQRKIEKKSFRRGPEGAYERRQRALRAALEAVTEGDGPRPQLVNDGGRSALAAAAAEDARRSPRLQIEPDVAEQELPGEEDVHEAGGVVLHFGKGYGRAGAEGRAPIQAVIHNRTEARHVIAELRLPPGVTAVRVERGPVAEDTSKRLDVTMLGPERARLEIWGSDRPLVNGQLGTVWFEIAPNVPQSSVLDLVLVQLDGAPATSAASWPAELLCEH